MIRYPAAIQHPSRIPHPQRVETRGVVIHWTAGREEGDLATLDGPNVDCHFYVTKSGKVYQFLDPGSQAWHAFHTANHTCLGIEHEGFGEAWTPAQLDASAKLGAWISKLYNIPVRKVDPPGNWHGFFGHGDLVGFESNDHTDTVPKATGWGPYLNLIKAVAEGAPGAAATPPDGDTLVLVVRPKGTAGRRWAGWDNAAGPLRWIDAHGLKPDTTAALAFRHQVWRDHDIVVEQARRLVREFL